MIGIEFEGSTHKINLSKNRSEIIELFLLGELNILKILSWNCFLLCFRNGSPKSDMKYLITENDAHAWQLSYKETLLEFGQWNGSRITNLHV